MSVIVSTTMSCSSGINRNNCAAFKSFEILNTVLLVNVLLLILLFSCLYAIFVL